MYNQIQLIVIINESITSQQKFIEENPQELIKYEALDAKKKRMQAFQTKLLILKMKGSKKFKFKDTSDFNSYFSQAQRVQRQNNQLLFKQKYGDSTLAYRSIGSQSAYNPQLQNQFRPREKDKQINPPMKYSSKIFYGKYKPTRRQSASLQRRNERQNQNQKNQHQRCKSLKNAQSQASFHAFTQNKSYPDSDDEDGEDQVNIRVKEELNKERKYSQNKTYFNRIIDIQQISQDAHIKKNLHNILVKIGKAAPNSKKHSMQSVVTDEFSSQMS